MSEAQPGAEADPIQPVPGGPGPTAPALSEDEAARSGDGPSHDASAGEAGARLPLSTVLLYALPALGTSMPNMLIALYYFMFATDVLLVSPGVLGVLLMLSRAWDAVSDPIAGYLSDRTRTRMGRRRPWMLAGALGLAVANVVLWAPPASLSGVALAVWVGFSLVLFSTASTALHVPYGALGVELCQDHHDRTRLFAYRTSIAGLGGLLALAAFGLLREAETPDQSWLGLDSRAVALGAAIAIAAFCTVTCIALVARVRERTEYQGRGPRGVSMSYGDVARNPHARRLFFVFTVQTFGMASLSMLAAYLFKYIFVVPTRYQMIMIAAFMLPMACSIPLWVRLSRRLGKKRIWTFTLWVLAAAYALMYFGMQPWDYESDPVALSISLGFAALLGSMSACGYVVAPSVQADVIDYDEWATNERKEGAYLSAWSFLQKTAAALAALLLGLVLEVVGYDPGGQQTETTRTAIVALVTFVPAAGYLASALVFRGFTLDEVEHARIRAELDARADGATA